MIIYWRCSFEVPGFLQTQYDVLGFDKYGMVCVYPVYAENSIGQFAGYAVEQIEIVTN